MEQLRDDEAINTWSLALLAVIMRIPGQPCTAALIDTNNAYDCCSGTVDSGHEDFSRVGRDLERHCVGVGSLARVSFFLESKVMNETKVSPGNERAIAPGTKLLLLSLVGESVGRASVEGVISEGPSAVSPARINTKLLFCTSYFLADNAIH